MPRTDWGQTWREYHTYEDICNNQKWCRLHWIPTWSPEEFKMVPRRFPIAFTIKSSRQGWLQVWVFCGPGAYLPKPPPKGDR